MRQQVRHHMKAALCILGAAWMLAVACSPMPPTPTAVVPQATPAGLPWGSPHPLGFAESLSAPSVSFSGSTFKPGEGTTMFAWAGADQQEARLYAQSTEASTPTILSLKVTTPLDVTLVPSEAGYFHLLWRDDVEGKPHLFYSLFNKDAVAVLDAYDLSEQPVYNFVVLPLYGGSVRVIYSAGWMAEPRLFVHDIDAKGRSQFPVALDQVGDFPALTDDWDPYWLFWQTEDGAVWQGQLKDQALVNPHAIGTIPTLETGDTISQVIARMDSSYHYLFWQIVRVDGIPETWYAVGEIYGEQRWAPAMRLTIPTLGDTAVDVGYEVGQVTSAQRGADPVGWSGPLEGPDPVAPVFSVPIVVQTGTTLGIAYLNAGNIIGYQRLATVGKMVSSPSLTVKRDQSLVVSWAEPGTEAAQLYWLQSTP